MFAKKESVIRLAEVPNNTLEGNDMPECWGKSDLIPIFEGKDVKERDNKVGALRNPSKLSGMQKSRIKTKIEKGTPFKWCSFLIFGLIRIYCILLFLDGFPNATTLFTLSFKFDINSGEAVLLLIWSCRCDGFHNTVHCLFGPYVTKLIWRKGQG